MPTVPIFNGSKLFSNSEQFGIFKVEEPHSLLPHKHDFLEICYVAKGKGYHCVNNENYAVKPGDMFFIDHNDEHTFYYKGNEQEHIHTYNIAFNPVILDPNLLTANSFKELFSFYGGDNDGKGINTVKYISFQGPELLEIDKIIKKMYIEYILKHTMYTNIITCGLIEIISVIVRYAENEAGQYTKRSIHTGQIINRVIRFLEDNYNKPVSLDDIASDNYISKSHLCRIFKQFTGMTIFDYIIKIRINNARMLIRNTDKKLDDIGRVVGFYDYKSFFSAFKKIIGISPSEYRKM